MGHSVRDGLTEKKIHDYHVATLIFISISQSTADDCTDVNIKFLHSD